MPRKKKSAKQGELFGHPVIHTGKIPLSEQIYDIIFTEIFSDRWQPGEKMPSMSFYAEQSGSSRMPVQEAIERLGSDGYIKQVPRSGLFLADNLPKKTGNLGTLAVLVKTSSKSEADIEFLGYEQLLIHRLLEQVKEHNYNTQIVYVEDESEVDKFLKPNYFSSEMKGIISLFPFPHTANNPASADALPLVFWCTPDHRCAPCIASDYELGMYLLTKQVIENGHTTISAVPCPILEEYVRTRYWNGYKRAMIDAGLTPLEGFYRKALEFSTRDVSALQELIKGDDATAYITFSLPRAELVTSCLAMSGVDIPTQKSVVSMNPSKEPIINNLMLTGTGFSPEKEIAMCISLIRELQLNKECTIATSLIAPFLVEGDSLAVCRA